MCISSYSGLLRKNKNWEAMSFRRAFVPPIISFKEILGGGDLSVACITTPPSIDSTHLLNKYRRDLKPSRGEF